MTRTRTGQSPTSQAEVARNSAESNHQPGASASGFFLKRTRLAFAAGLALFLLCLWFGGSLSFDESPRATPAIVRFLLHLPGPLAWMVSAFGLGIGIGRALSLVEMRWAFSLALGCAALLFVDVVAGAIGIFSIGSGQIPAALLLLPGIFSLWRNFDPKWSILSGRNGQTRDNRPGGTWLGWTMAPALATLLLATVTAPGWLWSTEFGGYDALSYHLQLPREWLALGRVQTLGHNIYSTFPSFVECAYLHVMAMRGSAHAGALDSQILHGLFALAAAAMIAQLAQKCDDRFESEIVDAQRQQRRSIIGWTAAGLFLGLPWIIATGSLAYDEMPVVLMLAATLWMTLSDSIRTKPTRAFIAIALLCAVAIGSKLTAALFVVAPAGAWAFMATLRAVRVGESTTSAVIKSFVFAGIVGFVVLSPWWIRGAVTSGSPFFPLVGDGGLSVAQAEVFHRAHGSTPPTEWWIHLRDQFLFVGLTSTAPNAEPWRPFWSVLPWMGGVAGGLLVLGRANRLICVKLIGIGLLQVALWLVFTHAKSRFLIPVAVPLVVLVALALANLERARWIGRALLACILAAWGLQPLVAYSTDGPMIEDMHGPATGIGLEPLLTGEAGGDGLPAAIYKLPPNARVVSLGGSAVFWWRMIPGYSTVWNENPVQRAIASSGGDPALAITELRRAGWTHLVIDPTMLDIWRRSGWLDPSIAPSSVTALTSRLKPLCSTGGGSLYSLQD